MATLLYEEMMDEVEKMMLERIVNNQRLSHPEAEQKLIDWFASKGIELIIEGWHEYHARTRT